MSITFYIGEQREDGHLWPAESCDCTRRWCDACDEADAKGEDFPEEFSCAICEAEVNLGNSNAFDLLRWVGIVPDYSGHVAASELAPKLRRRLWDEDRNHDDALPGSESGGEGTGQCRMIDCGRRPGYLREQTSRLLALCERAGDRLVVWA